MLKILSYFNGSEIDHEIFKVDSEQTLATWTQPPPDLVIELYDVNSFGELMTVLVDFAFLQRSPGRETYEMHPVVQDWCRFSSSSDEQDEFSVLALRILGVSIERATLMDAKSIRQRLKIHSARCFSLLDPQIENRHCNHKDVICHALCQFGILDVFLGDFDRAVLLSRRSFRGFMDILDADNHFCIVGGWNLAKALASAKGYALRIPLQKLKISLRVSWKSYLKKTTKKTFMRTTTLVILAETCAELGRFEKAERLYRQVLAFYSQNKPEDYDSITMAKVGLGSCLLMEGKRVGEAAEVFAKTLGTAKDLWPGFPKITHGVLVCSKLAAAYNRLGKYEEAKSVLLVTLSWFEKAYGFEDDWVFIILRYLGVAYTNLEQFDEAEQQYLRILNRKTEWAPSDESQWLVLELLADVLRAQNKLCDAEKLYYQILQEHEKALGPGHFGNFETKYHLGLIREDEGRLEEAEIFYKEAINGQKKHIQDKADTKLLMYTLALGNIARLRGRYAEATTLLVEVTTLYEQVLGVDHLDTLQSKHLLSLSLGANKQYAQAEKVSKEVFQGREKLLERNALPTMASSWALANVLHSQGRN